MCIVSSFVLSCSVGGKNDAHVSQEMYKSENYRLEIYWKTKVVGSRQRHGEKRKLFSIGGSKCELSMQQILNWAEEGLKRLDGSKCWKPVCRWLKEAVK